MVTAKVQGLHFRKLDLHVHTPASRCYRHSHTPAEIVQAAMDCGIEAIAITDHNTAEWIDDVKAAVAASEGNPLVIFPGVEISTHEGYHLVALFDIETTRADVENFLGAIGITAAAYGHSEEVCEKSVYEILDLIHQRGGLAILAHIDTYRGAFYELVSCAEDGKIRVPNTCARLFNDNRYDAVEVVGTRLPGGFEKIRREPAFYWASDNPDPEDEKHHCKDGIGARYSSFKLDEITLEGLRQCFADPEYRIHLGAVTENNWPHIASMRVGPNGFLKYQNFGFHPGLNCLIGGKGVGKSLAIEFLRFALGQPSRNADLHKDHETKLDRRLLPGNTVELEFQLANGATYALKRTYEGHGKSTFSCTNQATGEVYAGDIAQLFPILAYSQTEVVKIAEDQQAQLHLVDSLFDARPYQKEIEGIQAELRKNDHLVTQALFARTSLEEAQTELSTVEEKIDNLEALLQGPLSQSMRRAEAKTAVLSGYLSYLDHLIHLRTQYSAEITAQRPPAVPDDLADDALLRTQLPSLQQAYRAFEDALAQAKPALFAAREQIAVAHAAWQPEFEAVQACYKAQLDGSDRVQLESERSNLVARRTQIRRQVTQYRKLAEEDLPGLLVQRAALLDQLDVCHRAYYEARHRKFETLTAASEGKLRLALAHAANRNAYTEAVKSCLRGSGPGAISTANREKIAENVSPRLLGEQIIARNSDALADATGLTAEMARRAMDKFWDADDFEAVLALQYAHYPQDVPSIQYNKGRGQFAELDELSVGQKSTALLIIALCDGTMPVIIDQPEDALDIASVWQDIAVKLRAKKSGRQFILTTHNSSLAVGGDSDEFLVLTPQSGEHAKVAHRGAIDRDDVRRAVIDHLEGGDEPYKLRQRKYNIR